MGIGEPRNKLSLVIPRTNHQQYLSGLVHGAVVLGSSFARVICAGLSDGRGYIRILEGSCAKSNMNVLFKVSRAFFRTVPKHWLSWVFKLIREQVNLFDLGLIAPNS